MGIRIEPQLNIAPTNIYDAREEETEADISEALYAAVRNGFTWGMIRNFMYDDSNTGKSFGYTFTAPCDLYLYHFIFATSDGFLDPNYVSINMQTAGIHSMSPTQLELTFATTSAYPARVLVCASKDATLVKQGEVYNAYLYTHYGNSLYTHDEVDVIVMTGTPYLARVGGRKPQVQPFRLQPSAARRAA